MCIATKTISKNVVKKFVSIILLLKESMILFKRTKIQFYRIKLLKLVHTYIYIQNCQWWFCPAFE